MLKRTLQWLGATAQFGVIAVATRLASAQDAGESTGSARVSGPEHSHQRISAAFGGVRYLSAKFPAGGAAAGAAYHLELAYPFELTAGLRFVSGAGVSSGAALEAFTGGMLRAEMGVWSPSIGIELGCSGVTHEKPANVRVAPGSDYYRRAAPSPVYAAITAAPLGVHVGPLRFALFSLDVGTTVPGLGRAIRLAFWLGQVEVIL